MEAPTDEATRPHEPNHAPLRPRGRAKRGVLLSFLALLIALAATPVPLRGVEGACPYSALDSRHTMCVFKQRMCSGKRLIKTGGISCLDKEVILMSHNRLRQNLALGRVMGQPAALNMETMVWNEELASIAQRWADQCMPGHDRSRNIARFTVGQNVAAVWTYEHDEGPDADFPTQIEAWFDEVMKQGFSRDTIEPFRYSKIAGHYTQLAWADTYMVGCGYSYYNDKTTGYTKLYVCNYAPGGNVVGGSMYKTGYGRSPYCVPYSLQPDMHMHGLCIRDDVSYMNECDKLDPYGHGMAMDLHSLSGGGHSPSDLVMLPPPPHSPHHMMVMAPMHTQPRKKSPKKHRFMSHSHSDSSKNNFDYDDFSHDDFDRDSRDSHGSSHHPTHFSGKKGIPSPFNALRSLFSHQWNILNKLSG